MAVDFGTNFFLIFYVFIFSIFLFYQFFYFFYFFNFFIFSIFLFFLFFYFFYFFNFFYFFYFFSSQPNNCTCNSGYTGASCSQPICTGNCSSLSACIAPENCSACAPGNFFFFVNFIKYKKIKNKKVTLELSILIS